MSRPKGSLNRQTLRKLEHIDSDGGTATGKEVSLQSQVEQLSRVVEELTKQINAKNNPTQTEKSERVLTSDDLSKSDFLTLEQLKSLQAKRAEAYRELQGKRRILAQGGAGTIRVFESSTAPDDLELQKRIASCNRAISKEGIPEVSEQEKNRLKKRYDDLTGQLKKLVPSTSDQWRAGTPEYADAIEKLQLLMTTYGGIVREWKNIGKILNPSDPNMWNIDRLGGK